MKTKQQILKAWKPGDDARAAKHFRKMFGEEITPQGLRRWRMGGGSKLTDRYVAAYEAAQNDRRQVAKQY